MILHPSALEATWALPVEVPEGPFLALRLCKRRHDTDFLPRRPLCVIRRPGLSHASSWPYPLNVNHSRTHPVPKNLTPIPKGPFQVQLLHFGQNG